MTAVAPRALALKGLLREALGFVLGLVARGWLRSLRVEVEVDAALLRNSELPLSADGPPWVLCFFHGTQFALLAWTRRRTTLTLVSHSADGQMQAAALRRQGLEVIRGSSSRGGARALAAAVHRLKKGRRDAAFAVDGPRGPYGVVKEGAILAAQASAALLIPIGAASSRRWVFAKAWDRFSLPYPFSPVTVVLGAPIDPREEDVRTRLQQALYDVNARAEACLAAGLKGRRRWRRSRPWIRGEGRPLGPSRGPEDST